VAERGRTVGQIKIKRIYEVSDKSAPTAAISRKQRTVPARADTFPRG
jgi:hypothetical protein